MKQITQIFLEGESGFNCLRHITVTWLWWKAIKKEVENLRKKDLVSSEQIFLIGDMNINSVYYEISSIVENFFERIFRIITRPTKIQQFNSNTSYAEKNTILSTNLSSGILETDSLDHFLIFSYFNEKIISSRKDTYSKETPISHVID